MRLDKIRFLFNIRLLFILFSFSLSTYAQSKLNFNNFTDTNLYFTIERNISVKPSAFLNQKTSLSVSPLIYQQSVFNKNSTSSFQNGIGANIEYITKKFYVGAGYMYFNSTYPNFYQPFIEQNQFVPGLNRPNNLKNNRFENQILAFTLSYQPFSYLNIEAGMNKNFIGNGYRSLLLSDATAAYPFLKLNTSFGKRFKYQNIYAQFNNKNAYNNAHNFSNTKYGTFHFLEIKLLKNIYLGIFETVIWGARDTLNKRNFDINYINPVVFYRPVEYSIGSADNSLLGSNLKVYISKRNYFYGQLMLDEFLLKELKARNGWWANKYGVQVGFKLNEKIKNNQIQFRAEYNSVRPFTYSHSRSLESYSHLGQSLAHPLGANFNEAIIMLSSNFKKHQWGLNIVKSTIGKDTGAVNYGSNLLLSYSTKAFEYGNKIEQGFKFDLLRVDLTYQYLLFEKLGMYANGAASYREAHFLGNVQKNYFFTVGVKTHFWNIYKDYF